MTTEMVDRNESAAESFSFRNGIKVFLFDEKKGQSPKCGISEENNFEGKRRESE